MAQPRTTGQVGFGQQIDQNRLTDWFCLFFLVGKLTNVFFSQTSDRNMAWKNCLAVPNCEGCLVVTTNNSSQSWGETTWASRVVGPSWMKILGNEVAWFEIPQLPDSHSKTKLLIPFKIPASCFFLRNKLITLPSDPFMAFLPYICLIWVFPKIRILPNHPS